MGARSQCVASAIRRSNPLHLVILAEDKVDRLEACTVSLPPEAVEPDAQREAAVAAAERDGTGPRETTDALKSVGTADAQLNHWRALALVAIASQKKWRAGGGEAEKNRAVVRAFTYWRLRIGATFSACSTHQCRALLRHHRVANQP